MATPELRLPVHFAFGDFSIADHFKRAPPQSNNTPSNTRPVARGAADSTQCVAPQASCGSRTRPRRPFPVVFPADFLGICSDLEPGRRSGTNSAPAGFVSAAQETPTSGTLPIARVFAALVVLAGFAGPSSGAAQAPTEQERAEQVRGSQSRAARTSGDQSGPAERTPLQQWLHWEQRANQSQFRQPDSLQLPVVRVSASEVIVDAQPDLDPAILRQFVRGDDVFMPQHPRNTDARAPFFGRAPVAFWHASPTASRSVVRDGAARISIKLPTNYPHPDFRQDKVSLANSVLVGRDRARLIHHVEQDVGAPSNLVLLRDVMSIRHAQTGNGILVLDLSPLRDDHYYLPAFSIPYVGHEIAQANGADFAEFWMEHDARANGRAVAEAALRYGLVFENPHSQNRLIELDSNLRPTGRIVVRDLPDSYLHEGIVHALGYGEFLANERRQRVSHVNPRISTTFFGMVSARPDGGSVPIRRWISAYRDAFEQAIEETLQRRVFIPGAGYELELSSDDAERLEALQRTRRAHAHGRDSSPQNAASADHANPSRRNRSSATRTPATPQAARQSPPTAEPATPEAASRNRATRESGRRLGRGFRTTRPLGRRRSAREDSVHRRSRMRSSSPMRARTR